MALPAYVAEQHFDAIVLDVSFLTARWVGSDFFEARKSTYAFVRDSSAVKIAFPQDEYDCNELLDEWMCDWRVDVVFSVISSGWDVLYPRYHKLGDIRLGYTGYIDETLLDRPIKPFARRPIDIGYRAKKLPPYFGRIGETKWTVGRDVALQAHRAGLKVDIELGDAGTLLGDAWLDFIGNSKFTLGANSGSSLLDPKGDIQRSVRSYLADYPEASFDEVEAACFPAMEGRYSFTAISPRVLEAALLNSAQILVDGEYSGIVKAGEHFIPIRPDASNFSEVLAAMSDVQAMERMTARCREAILSVEALRYSNKARMILDLVGDLASRKKSGADPEKIEKVISRYIEEMQPRYKAHWRRQYFREKVARAVAPYPVLYQALRSAARILR
ncbi:MAG: hypothetical protein CVU34_19275 [Betaproteobacteria bacterium HGW-Betaproteobacteria-7]|nr:MAG: hypothetical protein CVU34_19275 [Betaproteobacteria bacterium HGW-Betaproteobacteria-7]